MADKKPKRAAKGNGRKVWRRIGLGALIAFLVVGLSGLGTFIFLYATTDLPDPNKDFTTNTTFLYYNDGTTQLGSLAVQNRVTLAYADMPQVMKDAVVAAENRTFWDDPGFSVRGMARGVWSILTGGELQGGSTITQQYIKILYLDSEQTVSRKVRELMLAIKMGREVPKEQILEGYLNTIYFGRGAYGIEAASRSYFLKPASELTLPEAAALAAILNNPAAFNPSGGQKKLDKLYGRYQYVLDGMLEMGTITKAGHDEAIKSLPEFPEVPVNNRYGGPKGFLIKRVEDELVKLGFSEAEIAGGGLKVVTTFDKKMQDGAVATAQKYTEQAVTSAKKPQDPAQLHVAISSVDTTSGAVLAMYGGPDYVTNSRNWATTPRPAASTFKAFAAVAGLRNGFTLNSILNGNTFTPRGDTKTIRNEFGIQYGPVTLRKAIADSINTAFVDMTQQIPSGADQVIKAANDAGAPTGPGWDVNNRIALGAAEVSPEDMANSYGTFADSGQFKETHVVASVQNRKGETVYQAQTQATQRIDRNMAADLTSALTSVVTEGTGRRASELGRPVAGKTGTNGVGDTITSAWFVGYTKQISTAVMYVAGDGGNGDLDPFRRPQDKTFFGSSYPLMTWLDYMKTATEGMPVLQFDASTAPSSPPPSPSPSPTVSESPTPTPTETTTSAPPTETTPATTEPPTTPPANTAKPTDKPSQTKSPPGKPEQTPTTTDTAAPQPTTT